MTRLSLSILIFAGVLVPTAFAQYRSITIAGGGPPDGVAATAIALSYVQGVAVDSSGNLYIAASTHNRVYKVATNGAIITVAGTRISGYSGDNGPAASAQLNSPSSVAVDAAGNLYIADNGNYRIRRVSGGVITTVAGTGTPGYFGDGGLATGAQISYVSGVALDGAGNLYIADSANSRIRKVSGGVIATVAGNGTYGYSGDGGPATSAQISNPNSVAVDTAGNLFIADSSNYRIRKVSSGVITTVAGNGTYGYSGDGGPATSAQITYASGVAVDSAGNLYIADGGSGRIRRVSGGVITTVAGNGLFGYSGDGGPATNAQLANPSGAAVDGAGNLYIADSANSRVRKVSAGLMSTAAGNGSFEYSGDNGPATSAQLNPAGISVDSAGNLYIADFQDYRIRKVVGGAINTVAGNGTNGYSGDNGPATSAQISLANGVAVDSLGNLYMADSGNARIRKVSGGFITTVAGNGLSGYSGDGGPATSAQLGFPIGIAVDSSGSIYITDQTNNRVRKVSGGVITVVAGAGPPDGAPATGIGLSYVSGVAVDTSGNVYVPSNAQNRVYKVATNGAITTVAGNGTNGYSGDNGSATGAQLSNPNSVAVDTAGNLFISDSNNYRIRKVSGGLITTVAGNGTYGYSGDGGPTTSAQITYASGVAVDSAGNLYIADSSNARIRKVSGGGITTVAGNGAPGYSGDGGPATSAQISFAPGVAADSLGNLYIADTYNYRIRKVAAGVITTVAGSGTYGYSGDGGPATSAQITYATGVAVDSAGNLYIADSANNRIRRVSGGVISTVAGNGLYGYTGDGGLATNAQFGSPSGVAVDSAGNLYIADSGNYRVRKVSGGLVSTIAGNGSYLYSGDGGQAINAQLGSPSALAVDNSGNLYISEASNNRVRVVSNGGTIATFAGGGTLGLGDGGPATSATLSSPGGLAVDSGHNVYIADRGNGLLRKVSGGIITTITTVAGLGSFPFPGDGGVAVESGGGVYVSEPRDGRVRLLLAVSVSSLSPSSAIAGTSSFTLTVNGSNFANGDVIVWNGIGLNSTFVSNSKLTATIGASQIAQVVPVCVQVATSNGLTPCAPFTILPPPTIMTTLALASSVNPSTFGQSLTLTATVSPGAATGIVTFYDGTTVLGARTLAAGQAALTTTLLPPGVRSLKAYYAGNATYVSSTSAAVVQTVNVLPQNGFAPAANYGAGSGPLSVAAGDFNGDGKSDLAVTNGSSSNVSVLLGNGNGTFQAAVNYVAGSWPDSVTVGDFNGDGKTDLAVANGNSSNVSVLLGNGNGTFQAAVNYAVGVFPVSVAVGDFNGDGKSDLAVANLNGNNVSVLLGNGDGTFQAALSYSAGTNPHSVAVGDFNGDSKADLAVTNFFGNNVSVLLGNGNGTFQAAVNYAVGVFPVSVAVGDFNGDGKPDLAVANNSSSSNNVSVLLGNGNGTFQAAVNYGVGVGPQVVALGDFNGDGKSDLAVSNGASNNVSVLLGNGNGTFQAAVNYGVGSNPQSLTVGDFNGDGRSDLAVGNYNSNNVSVLLGLAPFTPAKVGIFRSGFFWLEDVDGNQQFNSPPDRAFAFGGVAGDIPISGDWNGSGTTKVGVYRPSNGLFVLDYDGDGQFTAADKAYNLGVGTQAGDVPVVGDWNGDGKTKVGLFRAGFFWILDTNGNGVFQQGIDQTFAFGGVAGDVPVVGDWNGDGRSKLGLFRQGFFWILDYNGNGTLDNVNQAGGDKAFAFGGLAGDVPMVGDWNGDGKSKVGVFRGGFFWVLDGNGNYQFDGSGPGQDLAFAFGGISGDKPVVGKW